MTHPPEDRLLLLAYGELPDAGAAEVEIHLAACPACRAELARLERARVALDVGLPRRGTRARWIAVGALAAAAVLAGLLLVRTPPARGEPGWQPPSVWSATAGYIAGGAPVVQIDAQLTRLEQERYYGLPD